MDATILLIKDHDHLRRTRNGFCDISIHPDIKSLIQREKFLASTSNTAQLILLLAETFSKNVISVQQCHDDADTAIFRAALDEVKNSSFEMRAEDTNIMVLLQTIPSSSQEAKKHLMISQRSGRPSQSHIGSF